MRAGAVGVDITPDRLLDLEGYGDRQQPATGTLDRLEARALVLEDGPVRAALVALDLIGVTAASTARLRASVEREAGIPADHVLVVYSHTHAGPAMTQYLGSRADPDYVAWVERTAAAAVVAASRELRPARVGAGTGAVDFGVNRRRRTPEGVVLGPSPRGPVDRRVAVLRLDPSDAPAPRGTLGDRVLPQADPIALLFSCVCHPTALRAENRLYSADYPGAARRLVEAAFGRSGTRALFLPGCFGNVRPDLRDREGRFRAATPHETTVLGRWLGAEVVRVAERIAVDPGGSLTVGRREVRLPYARLPGEDELRSALRSPRAAWAEAMLDRIAREGGLPGEETTEVQVLRIGRHWIVALPGETTLEIGWAIENAFHDLGLARAADGQSVVTVGYANDYVCYLCTASQHVEGGYEPNSWAEYLRCGPFVPEVEAILLDAATDLGKSLRAGDHPPSSAGPD